MKVLEQECQSSAPDLGTARLLSFLTKAMTTVINNLAQAEVCRIPNDEVRTTCLWTARVSRIKDVLHRHVCYQ